MIATLVRMFRATEDSILGDIIGGICVGIFVVGTLYLVWGVGP